MFGKFDYVSDVSTCGECNQLVLIVSRIVITESPSFLVGERGREMWEVYAIVLGITIWNTWSYDNYTNINGKSFHEMITAGVINFKHSNLSVRNKSVIWPIIVLFRVWSTNQKETFRSWYRFLTVLKTDLIVRCIIGLCSICWQDTTSCSQFCANQ